MGGAFGSCGCSTDVIELITNRLKSYGMETLYGLLLREKPDEAELKKCRQFGRKISQKVKRKLTKT